jgi:hypothetical protein
MPRKLCNNPFGLHKTIVGKFATGVQPITAEMLNTAQTNFSALFNWTEETKICTTCRSEFTRRKRYLDDLAMADDTNDDDDEVSGGGGSDDSDAENDDDAEAGGGFEPDSPMQVDNSPGPSSTIHMEEPQINSPRYSFISYKTFSLAKKQIDLLSFFVLYVHIEIEDA